MYFVCEIFGSFTLFYFLFLTPNLYNDKNPLTNESTEKVAYSRTRPIGPVEMVQSGGSHGSPTLSGDIHCTVVQYFILFYCCIKISLSRINFTYILESSAIFEILSPKKSLYSRSLTSSSGHFNLRNIHLVKCCCSS